MHDWTKVPDGIFHAFHHRWISAISDDLNAGRLPSDYYALPEQVAAGLGPDILTLQSGGTGHGASGNGARGGIATVSAPRTRFMAELDADFYRRKKKSVVVRHVSGDRVVAVLEIVSPGNKSSFHAFHALVQKALELLEHRVHLLLIDPFLPGPRDPQGIHAAIWQEMGGDEFQLPADKRLTLASYECDLTTRAYVEPVAIGDALPDMPLFVEPHAYILTPLEATYQAAYEVQPARWREVLEAR